MCGKELNLKVDLEINPIHITQRRKSIRLKGYDYSQAGGYFVTIVTYRRECLFGEVVNGETQINPLGETTKEEWFRSTRIRKEIRLFEDEFVLMPNHIHGIVWIDTNIVGADGVCPSQPAKAATRVAPTIGTDIMTNIHLRPGVPKNDFGDIVALISGQEDVAISESSLLAIDLANNLI